ncbi:uncharacterized protein TNCV_2191371 [Trichonephila clavipes]|nr:uncharacterized protein TNCV_2191371 [Trichonephila clavipes]
MDIPELQAQLDSVLNIKQKYEALKEEYYRISKEKEFQKVEASIYEVDDDIQKLEERNQQTNNLKSIETQAPVASTSAPTRLSLFCNRNKSILINTVIVYVRDTYGEFKALRTVLDNASESSFLSSAAAHILGLKRESVVSDNNFYNAPKNCFLTNNLDILDKTLKRFWEIEEVETTEVYSDELKYCNDHFEKTHLRKPDGKFVVEMPFKSHSSEGILGNSKGNGFKKVRSITDTFRTRPRHAKALFRIPQ